MNNEIKVYQKEIKHLEEENEKLLKKSYIDDCRIIKVIEFIIAHYTNVDGEIWHSEMKIIFEILQKGEKKYDRIKTM